MVCHCTCYLHCVTCSVHETLEWLVTIMLYDLFLNLLISVSVLRWKTMSSNKHYSVEWQKAFVSCTNTASVLIDHNSIALVEGSARGRNMSTFWSHSFVHCKMLYTTYYGLVSIKALLIITTFNILYINFCYLRRYMASSHEHDWDIWAVLPAHLELSRIMRWRPKGKGFKPLSLKVWSYPLSAVDEMLPQHMRWPLL